MPATTTYRQDKALETVGWFHDVLQMSWDDIAESLSVSSRTIQRWRDGDTAPSGESLSAIERLDEFRFWITKVYSIEDEGADMALKWLHTRLEDLRGKTPYEALKAGRVELLSEFLATFDTGVFI